MKMAPSLVRLYEQMPEPKYVIAMGACTITGGMFSTDSYSTVRGVDKLIPVDIYLPGCPPRPESIIDAVTKLRKKVAREDNYRDKDRTSISTRKKYFGMNHQLHFVPSIHTGAYNQRIDDRGREFSLDAFLVSVDSIKKEGQLLEESISEAGD